jgi:hypothetical protein
MYRKNIYSFFEKMTVSDFWHAPMELQRKKREKK